MTIAPDPGVLAGVALFRDLDPEQLLRLATLLNRKSVSAGERVIGAEEPGEAIYILLEGSVKVHVKQSDDTEVVLAILGPGEIVGEMSVADSLARSASVTALEETALLWMDRAAFRECVEKMPVLARNLATLLSRRLRLANTHVQTLAAMDVPGRVAAQILALAREYGEASPNGGTTIPMPLTQGDLAALVGASRVRVNQALGYFKKRRHLSVGPDHRITVHDPDGLARRAR